jgi:ParB family chromosome partitioning protein
VSIGRDGKVQIERGLLKPEDAKRFASSRVAKGEGGEAKERGQHSAALVGRLTAHRTLALQAVLMKRPDVALAGLTHRLLLRTLHIGGGWSDSAVRIDPEAISLKQHAPDLGECKAHAAIEVHREQLLTALPREPQQMLEWLLKQSQTKVVELLAFCVALTVDGVKSQEKADASDPLARAAGLDMSEWWTATAANYFGSIPKARILEVVRDAISAEAAAPLAHLKKSALAKAAEEQLAGTRWLPSVLRDSAA